MKKFLLLLALGQFLLINPVNAQTFTNYTVASTSSQLCHNEVNAFAIDAQGNKWFGTSDGVSKFDGINWTTYTTADGLADNYVTAIAIDAQDIKWVGTIHWDSEIYSYIASVSRFDGTHWTTYTSKDFLIGTEVTAIAIDAQDNKWCGTKYGVLKFDGTTWTTYTTADGIVSNYVTSIAIDSQDNKWIGTWGGVSKYDGTNWTNYETINSGLPCEVVSSIAIDAQGNKWIGSFNWGYHGRREGKGVSKFDGTTWTTYTTSEGLAGNIVTGIAIDSKDNKWFATSGTSNFNNEGGVSKFDGTNWTTFNSLNSGLYNNSALSIITDPNDNIWLTGGFWQDGPEAGSFLTSYEVYKFDGTNWTIYNTDGLAGNFVYAIAIDDDGNKWFGTSYFQFQRGGLSKFDGTTWTTYTTSDRFMNDNITTIAIDAQGNKWVGTSESGVSKFDGTNWTTYTTEDGLAGNFVTSIAIDAKGNKWFGTKNWIGTGTGVSEFDGTNWKTYTIANGLVDNGVNVIAIDAQDNKWFGTDNGVSKFDGTTWTTYTTAVGLLGNGINAIAIDAEDNKWFASYNQYTGIAGVSKFDGTNWTTYNSNNGLASDYITSITIDTEGNKWFGNGGISKFDGKHWTNYTTVDGLPSNAVSAIAIDAQGNKWFGTYGGGVSKLSTKATTAIKPAPKENHLTLYPNPVQDVLHIDLSGKTGMYQVFDITGKLVLQKEIHENNTSIDVSGLVNGIYLLKILSDKQMLTGKFVKQ